MTLVTGSSDKMMKVWDISKSKPTCISETEAKIGMVHALDGCPDAPFVFAFGGDTPSHNMHVMDVRESAKGKIKNSNLLPLFKISISVSSVVEFPGAGLSRLRTINSELNGAT